MICQRIAKAKAVLYKLQVLIQHNKSNQNVYNLARLYHSFYIIIVCIVGILHFPLNILQYAW